MEINLIPDTVLNADALTVGELRKELKRMPADAELWLVPDNFSDDAWDVENEVWRWAVPLADVIIEVLQDEYGETETNVLLGYK